jgi:hypothetical protein
VSDYPSTNDADDDLNNYPYYAPFTSVLNNAADLPPFLRDLLANIEGGFHEESADEDGSAPKARRQHRKKNKGKARAAPLLLPRLLRRACCSCRACRPRARPLCRRDAGHSRRACRLSR